MKHTSLELARLTGKQHDKVRRTLRNQSSLYKGIKSTYIDMRGREQEMIELSEESFKLFLDRVKGKVKKQSSLIYLIKAGDYTKIGIASDIDKRVRQLQTGNPLPLEVIFTCNVDNAKDIESKLHIKYYKVRMVGEWFKLSDADIEEIKTSIHWE